MKKLLCIIVLGIKDFIKNYQILIGFVFLGLIISASLYFTEHQKQKKIMMHNVEKYKMCKEDSENHDYNIQICLTKQLIHPYTIGEIKDFIYKD